MVKTDPKVLLTHGLHLGHKKSKVHPKSKKYIFTVENGVSIIDLLKTGPLIDEAKEYITNLGKEGKVVLFVATKKIGREIFNELCEKNGFHYLTNKWIGGYLTNFDEVAKNVKYMNDLREQQKNNEWDELPKHERTWLEKKLNKISRIYQGVATMSKRPDVLFILDTRKEKNALNEARQMKIPTIAVVDTNVNPELVDYPIPANDDAVLSVQYIAEEMIGAYADGVSKQKVEEPKEEIKN